MQLSEMEMRILAALEEAGEEHACAVLNMISGESVQAATVADYQQALRVLIARGLIEIALFSLPAGTQSLTLPEALAEIALLTEHYRFSPELSGWEDMRDTGPPYFSVPLPRIVATDAGYAKAIELLEARGYEWWRQRQ